MDELMLYTLWSHICQSSFSAWAGADIVSFFSSLPSHIKIAVLCLKMNKRLVIVMPQNKKQPWRWRERGAHMYTHIYTPRQTTYWLKIHAYCGNTVQKNKACCIFFFLIIILLCCYYYYQRWMFLIMRQCIFCFSIAYVNQVSNKKRMNSNNNNNKVYTGTCRKWEKNATWNSDEGKKTSRWNKNFEKKGKKERKKTSIKSVMYVRSFFPSSFFVSFFIYFTSFDFSFKMFMVETRNLATQIIRNHQKMLVYTSLHV